MREWIREIGSTGIRLSAVIAGGSPMASMPRLYGYAVEYEAAVNLVEKILTSPIRAIDTSNNYGDGESERRIGEAISRMGGLPDDFTVMTKVDADTLTGDFSGQRVLASLAESEQRLGAAPLPLLYLHDPEFHDYDSMVAPGGAVDAMRRLKDEGRVGHIGIAGGETSTMSRYLELGCFDVLLTHNRWTLVDRSADKLIDRARAMGMGVVNAAPYGGGLLVSKSKQDTYCYDAAPPELTRSVEAMRHACEARNVDLAVAALQFSLRDPRIDATVVGFTDPARLTDIHDAFERPVPVDLWEELEALAPPPTTWLDRRAPR